MAAIGVFDSGVGGLSVLRALWRQMPAQPFIYLADQAHVPYGHRSLAEVRAFSEAITRFLLSQNAGLIVVACNTASAAALHHLRRVFPDTPFVGMEPAVKPAAETTQSGVVGVLATPATFQGRLYASVVERFASGVTLMQSTCPGLVEQIENGQLQSGETRRILSQALNPMLSAGIDTVVLGCTHYPFVIPLIEELAGPDVRVIDPAPAIARQAQRLGAQRQLWPDNTPKSEEMDYGQMLVECAGQTDFLTSGEPAKLKVLIKKLVGLQVTINRVQWHEQGIEQA